MLLRVVVVSLMLAVATMLPSQSMARSVAHLIVSPSMGHAGDALYLSGAGYTPHWRLSILLACPDFVALNGSESAEGPTTDANGRFSGFRFRAFTPRKFGSCRVYAGTEARNLARAPSQPYTILPHSRTLPRCVLAMCLHLKAQLIRLRTGAQANIVVAGWPGARVAITISDPAGPAVHRSMTLDWRGTRTVRLMVAPGLQRASKDRVSVSARLGAVTGTATAPFIILPGGR